MGGVFGGDSSVIWRVDAKRVRRTRVSSTRKVHRHEGVDETGENGFFTVTIKLPSDKQARTQFIGDLQKFVSTPKGPLIVTLPIEDKAYLKAAGKNPGAGTPNQIRVDWP